MQGLYLEEFEVGRRFEHALRRTVTEMDNTLFSCLTHNPQPLHIDHEFAAKSEWGKPLVNSLFTLGVMIGVSVDDTTHRHHRRQPRHDRREVPQAGVSRRHAATSPPRC